VNSQTKATLRKEQRQEGKTNRNAYSQQTDGGSGQTDETAFVGLVDSGVVELGKLKIGRALTSI
jgi:hypothetical protein